MMTGKKNSKIVDVNEIQKIQYFWNYKGRMEIKEGRQSIDNTIVAFYSVFFKGIRTPRSAAERAFRSLAELSSLLPLYFRYTCIGYLLIFRA